MKENTQENFFLLLSLVPVIDDLSITSQESKMFNMFLDEFFLS